jgi:hypothetical protein
MTASVVYNFFLTKNSFSIAKVYLIFGLTTKRRQFVADGAVQFRSDAHGVMVGHLVVGQFALSAHQRLQTRAIANRCKAARLPRK